MATHGDYSSIADCRVKISWYVFAIFRGISKCSFIYFQDLSRNRGFGNTGLDTDSTAK